MKTSDFIPWDYPEYAFMLNESMGCDSEYDDYVFDHDGIEYDGDCCRKCYGIGCNYCLSTAY